MFQGAGIKISRVVKGLIRGMEKLLSEVCFFQTQGRCGGRVKGSRLVGITYTYMCCYLIASFGHFVDCYLVGGAMCISEREMKTISGRQYLTSFHQGHDSPEVFPILSLV